MCVCVCVIVRVCGSLLLVVCKSPKSLGLCIYASVSLSLSLVGGLLHLLDVVFALPVLLENSTLACPLLCRYLVLQYVLQNAALRHVDVLVPLRSQYHRARCWDRKQLWPGMQGVFYHPNVTQTQGVCEQQCPSKAGLRQQMTVFKQCFHVISLFP